MKKFAVAGLLSAAFTGSVMAAPFADLAPNHWAYKQISALRDAGIIKGYPNNTLKGNENISRYEAAQMVYNALQYVNRMKSGGASVDPQLMDTINALIMELTDEMQIAEVRIEENSNAINALRKHVESHHGRGVDVPMGNGRIKLMGQAMFSLVSGGDNSAYSSDIANNNAAPVATANRTEGVTEFTADYFDIAMAADIDNKTSFHTRASIYTGGDANTVAAGSGTISFDDYMYFHVNDLWDTWDLTFGRMYLPYGHEVGGAFRTNPYFVTNSLVEQNFGVMVDGAFFSNESETSNWHYGIAIHNGEVIGAGNRARSHANHDNALPTEGLVTTPGIIGTVNTGGVNNNSDDDFGYLLQVGNSHRDGDFKWDLTWVNTGGDLVAGAGNAVAGNAEMDFFNFGMTYRANEDWQFSGEYVDGSVQNFVPGAVGVGGVTAALLGAVPPATDLIGRQALSAGGAGAIVEDDFSTWYLQAIYNLDSNQTLGLRYSSHEVDRAGTQVAGVTNNGTFDDEVTEWALAWTRKVSANGTLILEYSTADVDLVNGQTMQQRATTRLAGSHAEDDFDVIRASYRIDF